MTKQIIPAIAACAVLWTNGVAYAKEERIAEVLKKLEAASSDLRTCRAEMTTTVEIMGRKETRSGTLLLKRPDRSKMTMTMPDGTIIQMILSDGATRWVYIPQTKIALKVDLSRVKTETGEGQPERLGGDLLNPLGGLRPESLRYLGIEKLDGLDVYTLEGIPTEGAIRAEKLPFPAPDHVRVWVGARDGLLRRIAMYDQEGEELISQRFTALQRNVPIDDREFTFTPPQGVNVSDMTASTINAIKARSSSSR